MLISLQHDKDLLECPWIIRRSENKIYYCKYKFTERNEYLFLLTDLCLVWFEHGTFERMKQDALQELGMEIKDTAAMDLILNRVKATLAAKVLDFDIKTATGHVKVNLPLEKCIQSDIATLSWVFHCTLLPQENESKDYLSGPQFILQHFIIPSQTIINYFTENVLEDLPDKFRVTRAASVYTNQSLAYLSNLLINATNGTSASESQELASEESQQILESRRKQEQEREKELKRKRDLEEYNLKQQQKSTAPKRLKRL